MIKFLGTVLRFACFVYILSMVIQLGLTKIEYAILFLVVLENAAMFRKEDLPKIIEQIKRR